MITPTLIMLRAAAKKALMKMKINSCLGKNRLAICSKTSVMSIAGKPTMRIFKAATGRLGAPWNINIYKILMMENTQKAAGKPRIRTMSVLPSRWKTMPACSPACKEACRLQSTASKRIASAIEGILGGWALMRIKVKINMGMRAIHAIHKAEGGKWFAQKFTMFFLCRNVDN